ncbi:hypothetical protein [Cellulosimicrobium sp. Marseille-Q8652]
MTRFSLDALDAVTGANHVRDAADSALRNAVKTARDAGASWTEVGRALGISKSEARAQYKHAKGAVYLDEKSLVQLVFLADHWRCDLETALSRVVRANSRDHREHDEGHATTTSSTA